MTGTWSPTVTVETITGLKRIDGVHTTATPQETKP